jgi:hypothetical protein
MINFVCKQIKRFFSYIGAKASRFSLGYDSYVHNPKRHWLLRTLVKVTVSLGNLILSAVMFFLRFNLAGIVFLIVQSVIWLALQCVSGDDHFAWEV